MLSAACASAVKLYRLDKTFSSLESKRKKLTDMLMDDKITKEACDAKYNELTRKINQAKGERADRYQCGWLQGGGKEDRRGYGKGAEK